MACGIRWAGIHPTYYHHSGGREGLQAGSRLPWPFSCWAYCWPSFDVLPLPNTSSSAPRLLKLFTYWKTGFLRAAVPQLPLTFLNSVVAVCKLSTPDKKDVSPTRVSVSVGLMSLVGCWFGALPVCHGAGGLAGQYKFGATSGLSVTMLGAGKLVVGLLLGTSLVRILAAFPVGLLGVLELAMACRDQSSRLDSFVMLTCVAVSQASNLAIACVFTVVLYRLLLLRHIDCGLWNWARNRARGHSASSSAAESMLA